MGCGASGAKRFSAMGWMLEGLAAVGPVQWLESPWLKDTQSHMLGATRLGP
jgi:hypothetical protein